MGLSPNQLKSPFGSDVLSHIFSFHPRTPLLHLFVLHMAVIEEVPVFDFHHHDLLFSTYVSVLSDVISFLKFLHSMTYFHSNAHLPLILLTIRFIVMLIL